MLSINAYLSISLVASAQWVPVSVLSHSLWYFLYFFILFSITAWLRVKYEGNLLHLFQAAVNLQVANRMFNDNSQVQNQLDRILYMLYLLVLAFFVYYLENEFGLFPYGLSGGWLFIVDLALFGLVVLVRDLLMRLTGALFSELTLVKEYLYNIYIYNILGGVSLLPLMFLMVYTKGFIQDLFFWTSILVVTSLIIMRLYRGGVLASRKGVLIFYQFLYLCALEIAPLILLYRWLDGVL